MIDYSLGPRLSKPNDKESEKKVYPYPQARKVLTLQELSRHIASHGSPYTRDVIVGVATALVDCIQEQLLEGNKVQVGELGNFYLTFTSEGVEDANSFNPQDHIQAVNVRWECGMGFTDLKGQAEFHYVASRKQQAQARKLEKEAVNEAIGAPSGGNTSGSTSDDTPSGGNNGGQADPGDVTP
jgi:predicted histone-like DNA-binding protein